MAKRVEIIFKFSCLFHSWRVRIKLAMRLTVQQRKFNLVDPIAKGLGNDLNSKIRIILSIRIIDFKIRHGNITQSLSFGTHEPDHTQVTISTRESRWKLNRKLESSRFRSESNKPRNHYLTICVNSALTL